MIKNSSKIHIFIEIPRKMMNRIILHLDLDTFFVSVERLINPSLDHRPVVVGGLSERGVVSSCSYEARRFGVHSAMPIKMARQLCPDAVFIRGDMELYSRYSRLVTDIIADSAPIYEKMSIDEHYLDLTGMDRFVSSYRWAHELRTRIISESGLPISFGMSDNKTVSKIATGQAKPDGELCVQTSKVHDFLDPLSIRKIPMVGEKTYSKLRSMGVTTIGSFRQVPLNYVEGALGKNGVEIWHKANGVDLTPVVPYREQKSLSKERTFEYDTTDMSAIKTCLSSMVEELSFELRSQHKMTGCVTLKLRYSNFDTHTMQHRIPYTAFDHDLLQLVDEMLGRLYSRRLMVRLIGVRLSELVSGTQQLQLFSSDEDYSGLYKAMDGIRQRFGVDAICRASSLTHSSTSILEHPHH